MPETYPDPLDDAALGATWAAAWSALGRPAPAGPQAELISAWSEPQRHYHDQRHLRECLALRTRWREYSPRAGEVAIALWFHDAIHDPQAPVSGSNELKAPPGRPGRSRAQAPTATRRSASTIW